MKSTLIIVPMKAPESAKSRLVGALGDRERIALARSLYERTLTFLKPIAEKTGATLSVVTASETAAAIARAAGVPVQFEPDGCGLSGAVTFAARRACEQGVERLCVIPADLAAPSGSDVVHLLESEADVAICPSADGGTNALLVAPPDAIDFHFGPHSARRHLAAAQESGLSAAILPLDSLRFDIDTTACLRRAVADAPDLRAACG